MNRTRVLLVEINEDGTVGGSHQCLHDLACGIDRERFEPLALFYQDNPWTERLRERGVPVFTWEAERAREQPIEGTLGKPRLAFRLASAVARRVAFLRREQVGLLHLNNSPSVTFQDWLPAARLVGIPCITHARGNVFSPRRSWQRRLMASYDRVVPISRAMEAQVLACGIPRNRVTMVHDGIDLVKWRGLATGAVADVRAELGVASGQLLVLMVAHLKPWKGQLEVLHALGRLRPDERARFKLVFVGEASPLEADFRMLLVRTIADHGLSDHTLLLGRRDDVPSLMRAADVVLHASTDPEPFGLVLVEALALGVPVIAAPHGGPADVLTPDTGLIVDPRDPDALARALLRLAGDTGLRHRLGQAGPARAALFGLDGAIRGVEGIYGELTSGRHMG